jgi:hypothetical protein
MRRPRRCAAAQGGTVVEFACVVELKALAGTARVQTRHPEVAAWSLISEDILTLEGEAA